ncbi:hypothetical protein EOD39_8766 [Acipenser ruthenus]|uniref:Integrase catalytic domain-containing protein n=1 Tax=Acipenser ruthenus TaxID=7906 RepID=A0A444U2S5_ACIRT|nr:hypothetical protein EOD39_8766 [Acipenser ruthenus]
MRPAEEGKKAPASLPLTSGEGKGEKAPEATGPYAPPESARGEKAAEWTTVARRKKKAAARSTGAAKQGATKPRAPPSSGSDTGPETCVAEEGAVETAPEAEAVSAEKELPLAPVSGEEADSAPEAGVGSADNAEPMQTTPAEGPEGGEEPPNQKKSCLRLPSLAATGVPALVLPRRGIRKHPLRQTWALRSPRLQWSPERRREGKNQRGQKKALDDIFNRMGALEYAVLSDRGREFCNHTVNEMLGRYGVRHKVTAIYHPQTNGLDE